jgi:hypothetical protein
VRQVPTHGYRPRRSVTSRAVVRSITDDPPTLMVDEADTIFGTKKAAENNEDVRGIINAGHQRNRPYVRWDITSRSRELCPTFAMVMLAAIGGLRTRSWTAPSIFGCAAAAPARRLRHSARVAMHRRSIASVTSCTAGCAATLEASRTC